MALLFHVVPGERPYQTGAGPYGTTALDGGADPVGLLLLKHPRPALYPERCVVSEF